MSQDKHFCPHCDAQCASQEALRRHLNASHIKCICGEVFDATGNDGESALCLKCTETMSQETSFPVLIQCDECDEHGMIIDCVDDLCQGSNGCIHNSPGKVCPNCNGTGEIEVQMTEEEYTHACEDL